MGILKSDRIRYIFKEETKNELYREEWGKCSGRRGIRRNSRPQVKGLIPKGVCLALFVIPRS